MDKALELLRKNIKRFAPEISNYQLARLCEISDSALSNYFSGQRMPSLEIVFKIAKGLNVQPWELLVDSDEKNIPADILEMLENQPDSVYESIRSILKTFNAVSGKQR